MKPLEALPTEFKLRCELECRSHAAVKVGLVSNSQETATSVISQRETGKKGVGRC